MFGSNSNTTGSIFSNNPGNMRDQQVAQKQASGNLFRNVAPQQPATSNAALAMMQNQQMQMQQMQIPQMQQMPQFQPSPFNFAPPPQTAPYPVFGGFGGSYQKTYPEEKGAFYDEPIETAKEKPKVKNIKPCDIAIEMRACFNPVVLGKTRRLPGTCSLKSSGGERTSVDLACVIDISGSMMGQKIQLVKQTLLYLLELLNENDRLTLITFDDYAHKLTHLVRASPENMPRLKQIIGKINANGGNRISEGLKAALDVFQNRKQVNSVSSIFLLSDGVDFTLKECRDLLNTRQVGVYTLHSFGFGQDHDSNFLSEVATRKEGNFYYILKLDTVDEAFVNALGALFSVVAEKVRVLVQETAKGPFAGVKIAKTYGPMWKKTERGYEIELSQLISDVSKDFVFELQLPMNSIELKDTDRIQQVLLSRFEAITPSKEVMSGTAELKLTFFNSNEASSVQVAQDGVALANYLRAKTAECIENSMKLANSRQFSDARGGLEAMVKEVGQYPQLDPKLIKPILDSLNQTLSTCQEHVYSQVGQGTFNNCQYQLMSQNNAMYSNPQQCAMFSGLQQRKQGQF